jgi:hypothetical protein
MGWLAAYPEPWNGIGAARGRDLSAAARRAGRRRRYGRMGEEPYADEPCGGVRSEEEPLRSWLN